MSGSTGRLARLSAWWRCRHVAPVWLAIIVVTAAFVAWRRLRAVESWTAPAAIVIAVAILAAIPFAAVVQSSTGFVKDRPGRRTVRWWTESVLAALLFGLTLLLPLTAGVFGAEVYRFAVMDEGLATVVDVDVRRHTPARGGPYNTYLVAVRLDEQQVDIDFDTRPVAVGDRVDIVVDPLEWARPGAGRSWRDLFLSGAVVVVQVGGVGWFLRCHNRRATRTPTGAPPGPP